VDQALNDLETRRNASSVRFCAENQRWRHHTSLSPAELPQLDDEEEEKEENNRIDLYTILCQ